MSRAGSLVTAAWLAGLAMVPVRAIAGCDTDMECKGQRVCEQGVCVDPAHPVTPATSGAPVLPNARPDVHREQLRRSRGAATTGYVAAGLTAGFGLGAIGTIEEQAPAMSLGGMALLSTAIGAPIAAGGGANARRVARQSGRLPPPSGLATVAWVGYGLSMLNGLALLGVGAANEGVPTSMVASTVALGTLSTLGMAIDATTARQRVASDLVASGSSTPRPRIHGAVGRSGDAPVVGLAGTW